MKAIIDTEKCLGCGQCAEVCPVDAITIENGVAVVSDKCITCGTCDCECPVDAITFYI